MVLTHCWQRPGWPPLPPRFETEGKLPWAHAKVARGESFWFTSVDELPPEAARDLESFRIHGPKSNVTIPLIANGQVFGALAFATLGEERKWREDEIAELKLVAQIIGNVLGTTAGGRPGGATAGGNRAQHARGDARRIGCGARSRAEPAAHGDP